MSRRIADLLDMPEKDITAHLADLEKHNGFPSHDARYIAQTHQTLRRKLQDLQMDPDDTTAQELFHAMYIKFEADSQKLDWYFKAADKDFQQKAELASRLIGESINLPEVWAIKTSAAKKLLKQQPPKHVMKHLGYRSIDSLLKRQNVSVIFTMAAVLESANWHKCLDRQISKLDQTSFEAKRIELIPAKVESEEPTIISDLTGTIAISSDGPLLAMLVRAADVLKNYGAEPGDIYKLNWITGWWAETDNLVASLEDGQVSMNIQDVAASWLAGHGFEDRQIKHSRHSYWKELLDKYDNKAHLEESFDDSVISRVRKLNLKGPQPAFEFEYAEDL